MTKADELIGRLRQAAAAKIEERGQLTPAIETCLSQNLSAEAATALTDLQAQVAGLRELARYARHEQCWKGALDAKGSPLPCNCGLDQALAQVTGKDRDDGTA